MEAANLRLKEPAIRRKRAAQAPPAEHVDAAVRTRYWLPGILAAGALLIPLIVSPSGEDPFRYTKDLALRVEVILIVVALALAWGFGRLDLPRVRIRETWVALTLAICAWTILCALVSTNRLVSLPPTIRVLEYAVLFIVTVLVLRGEPVWFAALLLPPAVVNAAVYVLQELEIWTPFDTGGVHDKHLMRTAMLGNPNDVGSYLVVPTVLAAALALSQRRWRFAWALLAALLAGATFVTHTVAAIAAIVAALSVLLALWLRSWPKRVAALLALCAVAGSLIVLYRPLHDRALLMRDAFARRDVEVFTAERTLPFLTAMAMLRDRPLSGVGPGCFTYNFFEYKMRLQKEHRWLWGPKITEYSFGEVHNDHLQVASETGLPGYALFLTALVLLALPSWRRRAAAVEGSGGDASRGELARLLALPLAVSLFVLALAQFPLELVAPTHAYLWAAAVVVAWKDA